MQNNYYSRRDGAHRALIQIPFEGIQQRALEGPDTALKAQPSCWSSWIERLREDFGTLETYQSPVSFDSRRATPGWK
jgi:hypothetical protein